MRNSFHFEREPFEVHSEFDHEFEAVNAPLAELEKPTEITPGSRDYIRWVQSALNKALGLRLAVDGIPGPATRSAIRNFQQKQGLTPDGIVGSQTEQRLRQLAGSSGTAAPSPACPPRPVFVDCPPPGKPFSVLDNFGFDSSRLNAARHTPEIIRIAREVIASRSSGRAISSLLIAGHTDPVGDDDYNFALSRRRAETVTGELCRTLERISPGSTRGMTFQLTPCGERQPKATPELSRRVEVFLPTTSGDTGFGACVTACEREFEMRVGRPLTREERFRLKRRCIRDCKGRVG